MRDFFILEPEVLIWAGLDTRALVSGYLVGALFHARLPDPALGLRLLRRPRLSRVGDDILSMRLTHRLQPPPHKETYLGLGLPLSEARFFSKFVRRTIKKRVT